MKVEALRLREGNWLSGVRNHHGHGLGEVEL